MSDRKEYPLELSINGRTLTRVIIDQHYKVNHPDITDQIILDLVLSLSGEIFPIEAFDDDFEYFTAEPVFRDQAPYRVVMVLCVFDDYLGVINAFRVDRSKYE